jgi:hypothetical protein
MSSQSDDLVGRSLDIALSAGDEACNVPSDEWSSMGSCACSIDVWMSHVST